MRRVQIRGESILLSLFETFPDRREVASGHVDEIHVQLLQSQLVDGQSIVSRPCAEIGHLAQTDGNRFVYLTSPGRIFGGNVELGPVF